MGNNTDLNSSSIGIEIVNNGFEAFTDEQISSLAVLLERLKAAYKILQPILSDMVILLLLPVKEIPVPNSWKLMSEKGYGHWWDDTTGVQVPDNFDYLMGLRIIGYDISYPASALIAFKRHFYE